MDDESGASTTLRLLGFTAGLGITLGDDTDLDDGWTGVVGESDVGTAHKVELGFSLVLRGVTPDRRGWRYHFVSSCSRLKQNKKRKPSKDSRQYPVKVGLRFPKLLALYRKEETKTR